MKTKIANALFIFLLIICIIMLSFLAYRKFNPQETVTKEKNIPETPVSSATGKTHPAVVSLQTNFILPEMKDTSVAGTGMIIDPSGLILTNFHTVRNTRVAYATLGTGASYMSRVIAVDPENDIALLKIKNPPFGLPVIPLARPWKLFPEKDNIPGGNILLNALKDPREQSGGPLLDTKGNLTGINMTVEQDAWRWHYTVPLRRIENILAKYLLPERMPGMTFGLLPSVDADGRIVVRHVYRGSPAHRAGIRRGMEITSFQGWDPKHDLLELSRRMIRLKPGEPVELVLRSAGTVSVTPIPFAHCPARVPVYWKLGIFGVDLDQRRAYYLRYPFQYGVVITGGDRAGMFRRGDVIIGWNRKKIRNMEDLKSAVLDAPMGSRAFVTVVTIVADPQKGPILMKHIYPVFVR
ncbi:MAG: trypsin-like peptidase domain-containing protein [Lentisphaeria bacterium]|nr:trypsin-like peptidase domain-containing protein [Lentisphaeria bacterium]